MPLGRIVLGAQRSGWDVSVLTLKRRTHSRPLPLAEEASYLLTTDERNPFHPSHLPKRRNFPWTTNSTINNKAADSKDSKAANRAAAKRAASRTRVRKAADSKAADSRTATKKVADSMAVVSTAAVKRETNLERGAGKLLDTPNGDALAVTSYVKPYRSP